MTDVLRLLIGGEYVEAADGRRSDSSSPTTGAVIAEVAAAGEQDVAMAVHAAHGAFDHWSRTSYLERRRILLAAADHLETSRERIAAVMAIETGATASWAAMNVAEAAATLREAASLASVPVGEVLPSHDPRSSNLSMRVPAGVVLAIVPWNAPLVLAARSVAIALATGNTVILRPSEQSPSGAAHLLAEALVHAGIPAGVVNVLTSDPADGQRVIEALIAHPAVRRVVFIGSTPVGRSIAAFAGSQLTPAVLELGGKNPTIVLDDADLDVAAALLTQATFANSGQICMSTDRIIASAPVYDELLDRLVDSAGRLTVGDPRSAGTDLGPLIDSRAAARFEMLVADAQQTDAVLALGTGKADGLYAGPVILTGLHPRAKLYRDEAFSPIVAMQRAVDDADAVRQANGTEYGLIASVLSGDPGRARAVANRIHAGAVHVNGGSVGDEPHVPFGGIGASGFGRLGGMDSVRTFTEQRTLYLHGEQLAVPILQDR